MKPIEPNHWLIEPTDKLTLDFFMDSLRYPAVILLVPFDLNKKWRGALIAADYAHIGQYGMAINGIDTTCVKWQRGCLWGHQAFTLEQGWNEVWGSWGSDE